MLFINVYRCWHFLIKLNVSKDAKTINHYIKITKNRYYSLLYVNIYYDYLEYILYTQKKYIKEII